MPEPSLTLRIDSRGAALGVAFMVALAPTFAFAATPLTAPDLETLTQQVMAAETAFAQTLADRQVDRFADFVAQDAVFRGSALHVGRDDVVSQWRRFFEGPKATFSWAPDAVTVSADGRTAISTGPVRTPDGKVVSRFTSIWRHDADGHWRVIVDQGVDAVECAPSGK